MKNKTLIWIAYAIVAISGTLISFLIISEKTANFWISYFFTLLALTFIALSSTFFAKEKLKYFPSNFSFITVAYDYFIVEIAIVLLFSIIVSMGPVYYFCINLAALVITAVITIALVGSRRIIVQNSDATNNCVFERESLVMDLENASNKVLLLPDTTRKRAESILEKSKTAIRYSDPVNNPKLKYFDDEIAAIIVKIDKEIDNLIDIQSDDITGLEGLSIRLISIVEDRNNKLKVMKNCD